MKIVSASCQALLAKLSILKWSPPARKNNNKNKYRHTQQHPRRNIEEKEINYGTQVTADAEGKEHFFGNGTKNAQTDFVDGQTSPKYIQQVSDGWLNQVPRHHNDTYQVEN